jgi:hypothetical protein
MKPRDRIVVFRLSQEEYALIKEACTVTGARSLSEFTRSELLARARTSDAASGDLRRTVQELEGKIAQLQNTVIQLLDAVHRRFAG